MTNDPIRLEEIHRKATLNYEGGCREAAALVPGEDIAFLASLGVSAQVLLDYAEDFVRSGEPDCATFVRVVEIRRDYFRSVQKGLPSPEVVPESALPLRKDEWEGIPWLPRITRKATCFLQGTLCNEVMYGCSGDRGFLQKHKLSLPGFLETIRDSGRDSQKILQYVRGA
ncbi:MAG: hypothetical protein IAE94_10115 [Chthoniobacterales bacterium]|nr:hypothetical protein [Chthoniobacterales bacterium]